MAEDKRIISFAIEYDGKEIENIINSIGRNIEPAAIVILMTMKQNYSEENFALICRQISELCKKDDIDVVKPSIIFRAMESIKGGNHFDRATSSNDRVAKIKQSDFLFKRTLEDYLRTITSSNKKEYKSNTAAIENQERGKKVEANYSKKETLDNRFSSNNSIELKQIMQLGAKKSGVEIIRYPEKVLIEDTADAFRNYFVDRYLRIRKILLRKGLNNVITTSNIKNAQKGDFIILIVRDKYVSKGGVGVIVGEDLEGEALLIVPLEGNLSLKFKHIFLDSVLAFKISKVTSQYCMVNDIIFPEIPRIRERNRAENNIKIAMIGDLHVGSKVFLKHTLENFVNFLKGRHLKSDLLKLSEEIKYIIINGDVVDGVGIYPEQKRELEVVDIYKQYELVARYLREIPEDKEIIIIPGNHDVAGKFIPQPPIPREVAESLYSMNNVKMLGNPAFIRIEGVKILLYHGYGLEHVAAYLGMGLEEPTRVLIELIRSRHLMPQWGKVPIAPIIPDYLCIDDVPDILVTSHLHIADIRITAGGILLVSTGAFQGLTAWQRQLGISPTVGVVPIIDLKTYDTIVLNCNENNCIVTRN